MFPWTLQKYYISGWNSTLLELYIKYYLSSLCVPHFFPLILLVILKFDYWLFPLLHAHRFSRQPQSNFDVKHAAHAVVSSYHQTSDTQVPTNILPKEEHTRRKKHKKHRSEKSREDAPRKCTSKALSGVDSEGKHVEHSQTESESVHLKALSDVDSEGKHVEHSQTESESVHLKALSDVDSEGKHVEHSQTESESVHLKALSDVDSEGKHVEHSQTESESVYI